MGNESEVLDATMQPLVNNGHKEDNVNDTSQMFQPISAELDENSPTEIESVCMNCEEMGMTKIFLTKIPFYKEVILMSFECQHCGNSNNQIQTGSKVQEQGHQLTLKVCSTQDLDRQVVRSEYATINIPEIDITIDPSQTMAEITTVEGMLNRISESLLQDQQKRTEQSPDQALKIAEFLQRLTSLKLLEQNFTLKIDDPSGNSCIESPVPFQADHKLTIVHYHRTLDQNKSLGLAADDAVEEPHGSQETKPEEKKRTANEEMHEEVLHFDSLCGNCGGSVDTNMQLLDIPNFKDIVLMATVCERCGHRDTEVKCNAGFQEQGIRVELQVTSPEDLKRDVIKSDTCSLMIPSLELECGTDAMSSRYTSVEGILTAMFSHLGQSGQFLFGDSCRSQSERETFNKVLSGLDDIVNSKTNAQVIFDDPSGNSYVESLFPSMDSDKNMKIVYYERSYEQNDELGINDMVLENYETENDDNR